MSNLATRAPSLFTSSDVIAGQFRHSLLAAQELLREAAAIRNEIEASGASINRKDCRKVARQLDELTGLLGAALLKDGELVGDGLRCARKDEVAWKGFYGEHYHEVVLQLGRATAIAVAFLGQSKDKNTLTCLLAPASPFRKKPASLGPIATSEVARMDVKLSREAKRAHAKVTGEGNVSHGINGDPKHTIATLCNILKITSGTLNKYAKKAGVPTAGRGQRNFCWTTAQAIEIATKVRETGDREMAKSAEAAIASLSEHRK